MDIIRTLVDLFLHLDKHLNEVMSNYGAWTYAILLLIIFCETGLVVTPFLPGDSLLFAAGALAATVDSPLNITLLFVLLAIGAIAGDTANYWIGSKIGTRVFRKENVRFLNKEHLRRTEAFYEKHGGKTIILARFMPIIRTFAPFVAGMGSMHYGKFIVYNVVGGVAWVGFFLSIGYLFGQNEIVERNFSFVILAIIAISVAPAIFEYLRHRLAARKVPASAE